MKRGEDNELKENLKVDCCYWSRKLGSYRNFQIQFDYLLLGSWPILVTVVYVLVGAAGFWGIYNKLAKPSKK